MGKLRHTSISISAGKYLFGPINQLIVIQSKVTYLLRQGASSVASHERLGPVDKGGGKGADPCQRAGGWGSILQRNAGCLRRRSRRPVASRHKTPGTRGLEGRMVTGSQGCPDDLITPKGHNNQLRPGDDSGAAGVAGVGGQCTTEIRTCRVVLRQLRHSVVTDARGIQEISSGKQAAEGAGNKNEKRPRVITSHTSPFWQEKPSWRYSIEII